MTEAELIAKLQKIERLFSGAATDGERNAADAALNRVRERLQSVEREQPEEYQFSMPDRWNRRLFVALLRRYGLKPYRYARQRRTTVMARVSKDFVDTSLWPEYLELSKVLDEYISEVTERIIKEQIHEDASEAGIMSEAARLPG
jgi:hypothetical protein